MGQIIRTETPKAFKRHVAGGRRKCKVGNIVALTTCRLMLQNDFFDIFWRLVIAG